MINHFLNHLAVEKRYAENTLTSYGKDLKDFQLFLHATEGEIALTAVTKRMLKNFIYHLGEQNISKRTINRKMSTLRNFYRYLLKIGQLETSPAENIESIKYYPPPQVPMSEVEMEELETVTDLYKDAKKALLLEILYQTGLRKAELCNLKITDFDASTKTLRVQGKGNKMRLVPLSADLVNKITLHLRAQNEKFPGCPYLICNQKGNRLNERFVYSTVNSYLSLVTAKEKKSPHMLRHTFATHLLNNGAEITAVKNLMGHSSLASTQVYTHANIEQLKKVFSAAHPRVKKQDEN